MTIDIVPHEARYSAAVDAFNQRMREGGSKWGFYTNPEPDWIPKRDGAKTWREYYVALENSDTVRGGYALKPQQWLVNGNLEWLTDWQGPFTEAAIDTRFSPLMLRMLRGMLKDHPLLFSLGHGGTEEPIVELLRKMKWDLWGVPFCFHVFRPYRFLRHNGYLRDSGLKRFLLDFLAVSGMGPAAVRLLQMAARAGRSPGRVDAHAEVVPSFESWADDLWETHKHEYRCIAVRDREVMNALVPQHGWPGGTRLKIVNCGEVIGWSVVHQKQMSNDPRFGDLRVALITDIFGSPQNADQIVAAVHSYIRSHDVDLAFANLSHPDWINALRGAGYIILENRRMFALSPALSVKLKPVEEVKAGLHLTNMDGHGPHGFQ